MMMPANFSAVSENEMTYVVGGSIVDYLAPAMGAAEWSKFATNMITIVGNKYLGGFVSATVGQLFSGAWEPGNGVKALGTLVAPEGSKWYQVGLNVLGTAAAVYNLGFGTVKNGASDASINPKGDGITKVKLV